MNKHIGLIIALVWLSLNAYTQNTFIECIEPPFWWTGMKNHELQLLIKIKNAHNYQVKIKKAGISLKKNYLCR